MLTAKENKHLADLKRELADAEDLASRFCSGYTNYPADYVNLKLNDARSAYNEYLDSITEKPMTTSNVIPKESFILKASVQTYELSLANLVALFSRELGVPENRITIASREKVVSSDPMDRTPTVYGFDGLTITVKS